MLDGTITSWNPAATALFGYHPEEMIGQSVRHLIPSDRQGEEDRILARITAGERVNSRVTVRLDKEQRPIDVCLTVSPLWDQNGKIIGAAKIVRCIAQPKTCEALRWRQFVDNAPVAMLVLDRTMVHLACSRRWVELHGTDAGIGRYHYDLFPQVPEHWREAHRRGLAGETVSADEEEFAHPNGCKQWFRWEVRPWLTSDGAIGGITIMTEDVTDRVLAVQASRKSEMRMRLAQEAAKAGEWELSFAENRLVWPDYLWSEFGLQRPEPWEPTLEGWASIVHPADREWATAAVAGAVAIGRDIEFQWRLNLPEGEPERWLLCRGRPIPNANGLVDRYFGVVIDITEQKLMEEALRESEMRMRLAQEAARVGAWEWRLTDNSRRLSESLWSLYGLQKPEGRNCPIDGWASIIHPADRQRVRAAVMEAMSLAHDYEVEWRFNAQEGEPERWFLTRGKPLATADGSPDRYFGVVIDITEQKRTERALRESEMRMRLAQEAAKAGAWEWGLADNSLHVSDSLWSLYGLQRPQGWRPSLDAWAAIIHPGDRDRVTAAVAQAATLGQPYALQWRLAVPEGEPERWFITRGSPLVGADGKPERYFGVVLDITEQKLAENALRASEIRMRLAQQVAKVGAWELRLSDGSFQWSDSLWTMFGIEAPTPTLEAWFSLVHPEDRERVSTSVREAISLGVEAEFQWRIIVPEGQPERWFLSRGGPFADENGTWDRIFGVVIEITEQKLMEAALRESKDRQTFLLSVNDALRATDEPAEAIAIAASMLGQKLNASQVVYCKTAASGDRTGVAHVWNDGSASGAFEPDRIEDFNPSFLADLETGRTVVVDDVRSDPRSCKPEALALYERGSVGAFIVVPFAKDRRIAGVLGVHKRDPYQWKEDEVSLAQDVAQRTWDLVERALTAQALRESEERQSFLLSLNDALRAASKPDETMAIASRMLGQKLGAAQVFYAEIDNVEARANISRDWNDGTVPGAFPVYELDKFNASFFKVLRSGRAISVADIRAEARTWSPAALAMFKRSSIAAFTAVPLVKEGRLAALLGIQKGVPHAWTKNEVALAQDVAERTWEAVERAHVSQALRESEERHSFLLFLNDAFRSTDEPAEAIAIAAKMLGQKLNASRIVYSKFEAGHVAVTHSWCDEDGHDAFAPGRMDDIDPSLLEAFANGQAVVVGDVRCDPRCSKPETRAFLEKGSVAAFITVPLVKDRRVVGVLGVHNREPYSWKKDEVSLAQDVAHRTWDLFERALAAQALRESEERQSFLLALNDDLRAVDDPLEAIAIASKMLGQKLNASQVVYAKAGATGRASIMQEWNDGATSGAFAIEMLDDFAASLVANLKDNQTVAVSDVRTDPRSCQPEALALFELGSIAAFITVPFVKNGRLAGGLAVHKRAPHTWTAEEIALAREVAERTWEAVERAHVSQALRDSEDRLTFALEAAHVGSWELHLDDRIFSASDRALSFFDFSAGALPTYEEVVDRAHPDDRAAVIKSLKRAAETGEPYKIEFRRLFADGSIVWLEARGERRSISGKQVIGGLLQDITERVNQKEEVERAAKAKSEFLSNMSHELRTPMHAILGYSEICTNAIREGESEDLERYLKNIATAGGRLLGLLNNLLDLSKMDAGRMEYKFERADLKDVVEHALMELDPLIRAKRLDMRVDLTGSASARCDKTHVLQVLINLLSNAIKFSSAGSGIGIEVSEDRLTSGEAGVRCAVIDQGPGIPEEELKAVFDKFVQSTKTKTGKGGTGLGLAICDHIIKAHGGAIWAENVKPHGAVFAFVIPKDRDAKG